MIKILSCSSLHSLLGPSFLESSKSPNFCTMYSSSRTNDVCDDNAAINKGETTNKFVVIGLPLSTLHSSLFKSTTLIPPSNLQRIVTESSQTLIRNLHNSIQNSLNFLHLAISQNPLFTKLQSLSSQYHNFCQINCRNQRNMKSWSHDFAAIIPGDSVAGVVISNGVLNFLNIYNTLLVVRLVLTWFPNTPPAIVSPLSTLCDPYLNIFRGVIPPLGGTLDLSPILAFLVLNALTSTASALPAELPEPSHLTSSQNKWFTRFHTKTSNASNIHH